MVARSSYGTQKLLELQAHKDDGERRVQRLDSVGSKVIPCGGPLRSLRFSPDSSSLLAGSEDATLTLHDATSGVLLAQRSCVAAVHAVHVSPDSRVVASGGPDRHVTLSELSTGKHIRRISHSAAVRCVRFTPDGASVAFGGANGLVSMRNTTLGSGEEFDFTVDGDSAPGPSSSVETIEFTPDGRHLCIGSVAGAVNQKGEHASASAGQLTVCNARSGKVYWEQRAPGGGEVRGLAVSATGQQLACASGGRVCVHAMHGTRLAAWIRAGSLCWDVAHAADRAREPAHAVSYSPDGRQLACAGGRVVALRLSETGELLREIRPPLRVYCCTFSPDGSTLAFGGDDARVTLQQVRTAELRQTLAKTLEVSPLHTMRFTPNGSVLASSRGHAVQLTSLVAAADVGAATAADRLGKTSLVAHRAKVSAVAFSADGRLVASGALGGPPDGTSEVLIHSAVTGACIGTIPLVEGVTCLCFSCGAGEERKLLVGNGPDALLYTLSPTRPSAAHSPHSQRSADGSSGGDTARARASKMTADASLEGSGSADATGYDEPPSSCRASCSGGKSLPPRLAPRSQKVASSPRPPATQGADGPTAATAGAEGAEDPEGLEARLEWSDSYSGSVSCGCFSSDDLRIAVGAGLGVHLLEAFSSLEIRCMHHQQHDHVAIDARTSMAHGAVAHGSAAATAAELLAVSVSADGTILASAGTDRRIVLYELATGESLNVFDTRLPLTCLAFAPPAIAKGTCLLAWGCTEASTGSTGEVVLLDARSDEVVWRRTTRGRISALSFAPLRPDTHTASLIEAASHSQAHSACGSQHATGGVRAMPGRCTESGGSAPGARAWSHFAPSPASTNAVREGGAPRGALVRPAMKPQESSLALRADAHHASGHSPMALRASCALLVAQTQLDGRTRVSRIGLANTEALAFWETTTPPAAALCAALPPQMLVYDTAPSGRTLLAAACVDRRSAWISSLCSAHVPLGIALLIRHVHTPPSPSASTATPRPRLTCRRRASSPILRRDVTGRHALDHALNNRQSKVLTLLLKAVARVPPRARTPLVQAPASVPSFLPLLAEQYPKLVADFLAQLGPHGLDEYAPTPRRPAFTRVPVKALTCDDSSMALIGHVTSSPEVSLWDGLVASERLWVGQEVDCACYFVGVPTLLDAPRLGRRVGEEATLFRSLLETEHYGIISSDVMRAAIAYKWQAFGYEMWLAQLRRFALFLTSYFVGLSLVFEWHRNSTARWHAPAGLAIFLVCFCINLRYLYEEYVHLTTDGAAAFFGSVWHVPSLTSALVLLALGPALWLGVVPDEDGPTLATSWWATITGRAEGGRVRWEGSEPAMEVARSLGSLGALLMVFKASAVSRGHERLSFLVTMLVEVLNDMSAFLVVVSFIVVSHAFAFYFRHVDPTVYSDAGTSLFNTYSMLLGEFDVTTYVGNGLGFSAALFFYTTFLTNIVLLNALIAIMSDTYDRVTETLRERGLLQRGKLLLEQQSLMSAASLQDASFFPDWLHAIQRVDEGDAEGEHAWAGRMHAIKTVVGERVDELESHLGRTDEVARQANDGRLRAVEHRLTSLSESVESIRRMVQRLVPEAPDDVDDAAPVRSLAKTVALMQTANTFSTNIASGLAQGGSARAHRSDGAARLEPLQQSARHV